MSAETRLAPRSPSGHRPCTPNLQNELDILSRLNDLGESDPLTSIEVECMRLARALAELQVSDNDRERLVCWLQTSWRKIWQVANDAPPVGPVGGPKDQKADIVCYRSHETVHVHGKCLALTSDQFRIITTLIEAKGERIPAKSLRRERPSAGERPDLIIARLPEALRSLIESKSGQGGGFSFTASDRAVILD